MIISQLIYFMNILKSNININYQIRINEIYENIFSTNKKNNKKYKFKIDKENLLKNIKLDFIRKTILEISLNENIDRLAISNQEIDLL